MLDVVSGQGGQIQASTDQSAVDMEIPYQVGAFAFSMIQLLGIIAVIPQILWQVVIIFIHVIATCGLVSGKVMFFQIPCQRCMNCG